MGRPLRVLVQSLSRVRLFVTSWTVACHPPLSMGFSRQEYWSGLPFPTPGGRPLSGDLAWISCCRKSSSVYSDMMTVAVPSLQCRYQFFFSFFFIFPSYLPFYNIPLAIFSKNFEDNRVKLLIIFLHWKYQAQILTKLSLHPDSVTYQSCDVEHN